MRMQSSSAGLTDACTNGKCDHRCGASALGGRGRATSSSGRVRACTAAGVGPKSEISGGEGRHDCEQREGNLCAKDATRYRAMGYPCNLLLSDRPIVHLSAKDTSQAMTSLCRSDLDKAMCVAEYSNSVYRRMHQVFLFGGDDVIIHTASSPRSAWRGHGSLPATEFHAK